MSNNELNLLVTKMGEAITENLNKFKVIWLIINIIITSFLIILSIYVYYSYKQIDELRVNLEETKAGFNSNHTPRKIDYCFQYQSK